MNKRGISHIEVLLSFLIFVGFVIFAFYFFSPFKASRLIESSLTYAEKEIIKNATIEIEIYSVELDVSDPQYKDKPVQILVKDYEVSKNVQARNKNGEIVLAKKVSQGGGVTSDHISLDTTNVYDTDPTKGFIILKFGDGLTETPPAGLGSMMGSEWYTIISSEEEKFISESRLINLKNAYDKNYEGVRSRFNLPSRANFEFEVYFSAIDVIAARRPLRPQSEEIFSNIKRIEVLRNNGNVEFADLKIRVW